MRLSLKMPHKAHRLEQLTDKFLSASSFLRITSSADAELEQARPCPLTKHKARVVQLLLAISDLNQQGCQDADSGYEFL